MPKLFGKDIAGIIAKGFKNKLVLGVLTKSTPGVRDPLNLSAGTNPTYTNYSFEGFISMKREVFREGTLVQQGGRSVAILGGSLANRVQPEEGDTVTIEGETFTLERVDRDPAGALFESRIKS